jgi:hypothetical protein
MGFGALAAEVRSTMSEMPAFERYPFSVDPSPEEEGRGFAITFSLFRAAFPMEKLWNKRSRTDAKPFMHGWNP